MGGKILLDLILYLRPQSEEKAEKGANKEPDVAEADVFGSDLSISSEEEAEAAKDEEVKCTNQTVV